MTLQELEKIAAEFVAESVVEIKELRDEELIIASAHRGLYLYELLRRARQFHLKSMTPGKLVHQARKGLEKRLRIEQEQEVKRLLDEMEKNNAPET